MLPSLLSSAASRGIDESDGSPAALARTVRTSLIGIPSVTTIRGRDGGRRFAGTGLFCPFSGPYSTISRANALSHSPSLAVLRPLVGLVAGRRGSVSGSPVLKEKTTRPPSPICSYILCRSVGWSPRYSIRSIVRDVGPRRSRTSAREADWSVESYNQSVAEPLDVRGSRGAGFNVARRGPAGGVGRGSTRRFVGLRLDLGCGDCDRAAFCLPSLAATA